MDEIMDSSIDLSEIQTLPDGLSINQSNVEKLYNCRRCKLKVKLEECTHVPQASVLFHTTCGYILKKKQPKFKISQDFDYNQLGLLEEDITKLKGSRINGNPSRSSKKAATRLWKQARKINPNATPNFVLEIQRLPQTIYTPIKPKLEKAEGQTLPKPTLTGFDYKNCLLRKRILKPKFYKYDMTMKQVDITNPNNHANLDAMLLKSQTVWNAIPKSLKKEVELKNKEQVKAFTDELKKKTKKQKKAKKITGEKTEKAEKVSKKSSKKTKSTKSTKPVKIVDKEN